MISFWRTYAVAAAWAVVLLPLSLAVYLLAAGLADGSGLPNTEDVVWASMFAIFLILPAMAVVDLAVTPVWILWRRPKAHSVLALGSQSALVGTVAGLGAFLIYLAVS